MREIRRKSEALLIVLGRRGVGVRRRVAVVKLKRCAFREGTMKLALAVPLIDGTKFLSLLVKRLVVDTWILKNESLLAEELVNVLADFLLFNGGGFEELDFL